MSKSIPPNVAQAFDGFEPEIRSVLKDMRALVFEAAESVPEVGEIEETLKWGEPSYLTPQTKAGSTIRLAKSKVSDGPAFFVNCQSKLVEQFKTHYGDLLKFDGTRAVFVNEVSDENRDALKHCFAMALTYHLNKKKS